jgi:hypothetical protein
MGFEKCCCSRELQVGNSRKEIGERKSKYEEENLKNAQPQRLNKIYASTAHSHIHTSL